MGTCTGMVRKGESGRIWMYARLDGVEECVPTEKRESCETRAKSTFSPFFREIVMSIVVGSSSCGTTYFLVSIGK